MSEQLLLDDEWAIYIQDEIDAQPDANCEDAYHMGTMDRALGLHSRSCEYISDVTRMAYVAGYCAPLPGPRLLSDEECVAELEEYQGDIADRDFWAGGQW